MFMKMSMRLLIAIVIVVCASPTVDAGLFRRRAQSRGCAGPASSRPTAMPCQPYGGMTMTTVAPAPAPPVSYQAGGEEGAFLSRLNAWRAQHGRGPVGWDQTLAAYAASNSWEGHQPGSTGGAAQCWASYRSLGASLEAWFASPAHAAILLNATTAVGASLCPSGATCNAR